MYRFLSICFCVQVFEHMFLCTGFRAYVSVYMFSSICFCVQVFKHMFLCTGFRAYNKTRWKGSEINLQFAKDSFIKR